MNTSTPFSAFITILDTTVRRDSDLRSLYKVIPMFLCYAGAVSTGQGQGASSGTAATEAEGNHHFHLFIINHY